MHDPHSGACTWVGIMHEGDRSILFARGDYWYQDPNMGLGACSWLQIVVLISIITSIIGGCMCKCKEVLGEWESMRSACTPIIDSHDTLTSDYWLGSMIMQWDINMTLTSDPKVGVGACSNIHIVGWWWVIIDIDIGLLIRNPDQSTYFEALWSLKVWVVGHEILSKVHPK